MADNPASSALSFLTNGSSNNGLSGPVGVDTSYQFGDWISGNTSAKTAAANQAKMDYAEWLRNEYSAKQQRDFELYMSNTQVQRAMADLKAAGLNPWLAVQSAGFGGSVPSGSAATSSAGQANSGGSPGSGLGMALASAYGIAKLIKVIAKLIK